MEKLQFKNVYVFQGEDGAWHLSYECGNSRKILPLAEINAAQQRVQLDECPTCAGLGFVNDNRGRRGVDCSDCNGSGIRR